MSKTDAYIDRLERRIKEQVEEIERLKADHEALKEYFDASEDLSKFIALTERDIRHEGRAHKARARLRSARKAANKLIGSE